MFRFTCGIRLDTYENLVQNALYHAEHPIAMEDRGDSSHCEATEHINIGVKGNELMVS